MGSPFKTMNDTLYAGRLAVAAVYKPLAGGSVALRAIRSRPDRDAQMWDTGAKTAGVACEIRVADVAQPVDGDRIEFDGEAFIVKGFERDGERLTWTLTLRATT